MPTHKIEILGSIIEINYEEKEYDRLIRIIEKFNNIWNVNVDHNVWSNKRINRRKF